MNTLWKKSWTDLVRRPRRALLAVLAAGLAVASATAALASLAILQRDIPHNYDRTHPPDAVFTLSEPADAWRTLVLARADVANAEVKRVLWARARTSSTRTVPLRILVEPELGRAEVGRYELLGDATTPRPGELLLERASRSVSRREVGETLEVLLDGNSTGEWQIAGEVHDPALAPGWMERMVYAYASTEALERLGVSGGLNELWVQRESSSIADDEVWSWARALRSELEQAGAAIAGTRVLAPGRHPHHVQMQALLYLLATFGGLISALAALLLGLLMHRWMVAEERCIGVWKSLGGSSWSAAASYARSLATLGCIAAALGVPVGWWLGGLYARLASTTLNFQVLGPAPGWVVVVAVGFALLLPVMMAAIPIWRHSRRPARELLASGGPSRTTGALLGDSLRRGPHALRYVVRNVVRKPGRTLASGAVLAIAGGVFLTAQMVGSSWTHTIESHVQVHSPDVLVWLTERRSISELRDLDLSISGTDSLEFRYQTKLELKGPDGDWEPLDVVARPRDSGHDAAPMLTGSWLPKERGGTPAIVINHVLHRRHPDWNLGQERTLRSESGEHAVRLVGVIRSLLPFPTAYIDMQHGAPALGLGGWADRVLFRVPDGSGDEQWRVAGEAENRLRQAGLVVAGAHPKTMVRDGFVAHIEILIDLLLAVAALIGVVGGISLWSAMSLNIHERFAEIGVLRAVGASNRWLLGSLVGEGAATALTSVVLAAVLALLLSPEVGDRSAWIFLGIDLDRDYRAEPFVTWTVVAAGIGGAAAWWPARRALKVSIREVLSRV